MNPTNVTPFNEETAQENTAALLAKYEAVYAQWHLSEGMPVEIAKEDGSVYAGVWNGYYDLGMGRVLHSVGYWVVDKNSGWSHGVLATGHRILTPVPTPEQWNQYRAIIEARLKPKAA